MPIIVNSSSRALDLADSMLNDTFSQASHANLSHLVELFNQQDNLTSANDGADIYDYDYDDSTGHLPLDDLVPNALGYGLTLVLGLTGNILVIVSVARYRRMHNVTNIFLLSLATADLLLVTTCVPVKFARFFTFTWQYGEVLCKFVHYLQNVTIICSVLNLTGLSLERYYAILHPMRAKYTCTVTMARRFVVLIWTMSIVMAIPILIGQRQVLVGKKIQGYWCVEEWSPLMAKIYNLYMILVVFVLPLGLMAYAYTCICRRLWQVQYQHSTMRASQYHIRPERTVTPLPSPQYGNENRSFLRTSISIYGKRIGALNEDSTRKQVVKMLVFVVFLFAVCWGPIMMNNVLVSFDILHRLNHGFLKPMRQLFWLMAYVNSCLNPIVYGFMSKNFRESFRNTFRLCLLRSSPRDVARHKALWRCSFQAPSALHVINRFTYICIYTC
ncbi:QRFP-like peptide receptor [Biomphalaria glabrata]|uniref:QRFP-like peptide receptor n=1 Tax=Biomphalaria glabrata TaxID=6526 RepID=A0A9W3AAI9_BIOGL|nr:QRFP-like peptide receptor [Biomphalaria glabrata]